jgi:hypothetical protein
VGTADLTLGEIPGLGVIAKVSLPGNNHWRVIHLAATLV